MSIQPGMDIGRYHILEQLGEGGMAVVYKAYDTRLESEVAVKVIRTENILPKVLVKARKRFQIEAQRTAQLQHPHIVPVIDYGEYKGIPYLVMPYYSNGTLSQYKEKTLSWEKAVSFCAPIADALAYAHEHGLVHRDVKPSNILLTENGLPMLTDFGIVKVLESEETIDLTGTSVGIGTPEYMSPEQAEGKLVDHRTDIYALGIVLYELVTGRKPFSATTPMAVLIKQIHDPLPDPKQYVVDLPSHIERILYKTLAKQPENRYQSMQEFALALKQNASDTHDFKRTERQIHADILPGKLPWRLIVFACAFIVVGITAAFLFIQGGEKKNDAGLIAPPAQENGVEFSQGSESDLNAGEPSGAALNEADQLYPAEASDTENAAQPGSMISPADGMQMVFVPAGSFIMGAANDPDAYDDEKPEREIYLPAFWIDKTEVTNAMFEKCVNAGVCLSQKKFSHNPSTGSYNFGESQYADYPAVYVNWEDGKTYCEWVGRRLPTEAEWEKAARGPDGYKYPWGNSDPDATYANFNASIGDTQPVGSYPKGASYYGALDMAGNVYEWVSDWYAEKYDPNDLEDPQGPASGEVHVLRGGSFFPEKEYLRSSFRASAGSAKTEVYGSGNWGFRCVMDAE